MELKQKYEIDKESYYKAKKYVIKIYPENIPHIESLDARERDQFINDSIEVYINQYKVKKQKTEFEEKLKKAFIYLVWFFILLAMAIFLFRFATIYSNESDAKMQQNFEKLFNKYDLNWVFYYKQMIFEFGLFIQNWK